MEASKKIRYDVMALQETKVSTESTRRTNEGDLIVLGTKVDKKNIGGVGFIVHRNIERFVESSNIINPRLAVLKIRLTKTTAMTIINAYAPTSAATDKEKETFYNELEKITKQEKAYYKIICGDFNATINEPNASTIRVGRHGHGTTNENGEQLIDFMEACNLFHGNSLFQKKTTSRWTWISPNGATHSELDHILVNRRWMLYDVEVVEAFQTGSDHRLLRAKVHLKEKMKKKDGHRPTPIRLPEYSIDILEAAAAGFDWKESNNLTEDYKHLVDGILHCSATSMIAPTRNSTRRLDEKARNLLRERARIHQDPKSSLLDRATINKACRITVRESIRAYKNSRLKEAAEKRASLKRCKRDLAVHRPVTTVMRDSNGQQQTSRQKIEKIVADFYTDLYKSTTHVNRTPTPNQDRAPEILISEVKHAIKQMKPKTAPGPDHVTGDFLKTCNNIIIQKLTERFNRYLADQQIPDQWKSSKTVLLFKKGERDNIKNYRPIALLCHPYKLFTKIILNRLEKTMDEFQPVEQAGFRRGFCCMDHIHTVTQLIEKTREYKQPLLICFIDYVKAFDSIELNAVWNSLLQAGVEPAYINILEECNVGTSTKIKMFHKDLNVPIGKGVRQGDTISPKLFTAALNHAMLNLDWENKGISIDGKKLSNLRFADDIALISNSNIELQEMVDELNAVGRSIGLTMNRSKTEVMRNRWADTTPITVEGTPLPDTDRYIYLGRLISMDNNLKAEISRRRSSAWAALANIREATHLITDKKIRANLFDSTVLPALCYASETWADNKTSATTMTRTQRALERSLLGTNRREQREKNLRSTDLRQQSGIRDVASYMSKSKLRWAGHVVRRTDDRWTTRMTFWYPRDIKRTLGRPATRWSDTLKSINTPGSHWSQLAQDRLKWKETCAHR